MAIAQRFQKESNNFLQSNATIRYGDACRSVADSFRRADGGIADAEGAMTPSAKPAAAAPSSSPPALTISRTGHRPLDPPDAVAQYGKTG